MRQINCERLWQIWFSLLKISTVMQKRFCSQARANWLGKEIFLQYRNKEDNYLKNGTKGAIFFLTLSWLWRQFVIKVQKVCYHIFKCSSLLASLEGAGWLWPIVCILPHLALFAWCGELYILGQDLIPIWWIFLATCLAGVDAGLCSVGAFAKY